MEKCIKQLELTLREMHEQHVRLLDLIQQKQQAMRTAKPTLVSELCTKENTHVQMIGELEKRRQALVAQLSVHLVPDATQPLAFAVLAENLEEPVRGILLVLHEQLREIIRKVKHQNSVVQAAGESLLNHVKGVMQMVTQAVGPGTYSKSGNTRINPQTSGTFSATA